MHHALVRARVTADSIGKTNDTDKSLGENTMRRWLILVVLSLAPVAAGPAAAQTPPVAANGCLMCHGVNGQGANGIPAIMRVQSQADFTATMKLFAENKKPSTIMGRISRGYTDEDIAELSAWFAKP